MRRATLPTLLIAAALPLATVGAVVAIAPVASAAACSDLEVVFARGTGEAPGLGIVGTPLVKAIKSALPNLSVTSYAVDYAASADQSSAGPGGTSLTNHVTSQAAACPSQRFVLGGYSQGASVVDVAIGAGSYLGKGTAIPTSLAPRVAAVAVFGNPLGITKKTLQQASPLYGPKSIEFCNPGDQVCAGTGTGPGNGHLSYASDGSIQLAAKFVAAQVGAAPAPTSPSPAPGTPVTTTPAAPTSPVTTAPASPTQPPVTSKPSRGKPWHRSRSTPVTTTPAAPVTATTTTPPPADPDPGTPPASSSGWLSGLSGMWGGISQLFGGGGGFGSLSGLFGGR